MFRWAPPPFLAAVYLGLVRSSATTLLSITSETMAPFTPKQCFPKNADLYAEIVGDATSNVAQHFISSISPFSPKSIIHDNGCGGGEVTAQIMATNPPASIKIQATDVDRTMLENCKKLSAARGWPVTTAVMLAEALEFADDTFTHSLSNFLIFHTPNDGVDCAKEIYRTLQPGGLSIVTTFAEIPHQEIIKSTHREMRGPEVALPHGMPDHWYQSSHLKSVLIEGGFESDKIELSTVDVYTKIADLKHWVTILWSYVGAPATGWTVADEENWEAAIARILDQLESSSSYEKNRNGKGGRLKMLANVAASTK